MNARTMPPLAEPPSRQRQREAPKGRAVDAIAQEVRRQVGPGPLPRDMLIEYLHKLHDAHGHLGTGHLAALAQEMGLAEAEVHEVASFYPHFQVLPAGEQPPAACTVRVCEGLSCEMAGAHKLRDRLLDRLPQLLGDEVRVMSAPCMGRCEQAPAAAVDQNPVPHATCEAVAVRVKAGELQHRPAGFISHAAYVADGGYHLLKQCIGDELDVESVIQAMEVSGLRGLSGSGVPVGRKWRIVRNQPAPRLMAVNMGDSEPGSFKDRHYLERDPHRFLEGMLIAAWAVGASRIYLHLRNEYHGCRTMLEAELACLRARPPYPGMPEIVLRRGAGACTGGEWSAMIASLEGRRGRPRPGEPELTQAGLFGRPTLVHGFETLYWVREIVEQGGAWFAAQGRHGRQGLRSFSVSGRVRSPGVKLAPAGITVRELIDEYCGGMQDGHSFYAYLPGGASGGILPASLGDVPMDFDTLQPHGGAIGPAAVIVLSDRDTATDAARSMMRFLAQQSGGGGQAASHPIDCIAKHFPHELKAN